MTRSLPSTDRTFDNAGRLLPFRLPQKLIDDPRLSATAKGIGGIIARASRYGAISEQAILDRSLEAQDEVRACLRCLEKEGYIAIDSDAEESGWTALLGSPFFARG